MGIYPPQDVAKQAAQSTGGRKRRIPEPPKAVIESVLPESPADDAGFTPGCIITSVDGQPVRDMIDWRWLTADDVITLGYTDTDGDSGEVELERYEGEEWGFEFSGVVFDGVKQCRNACIFCFMRQLPDDMRPSLTLRDDDFRLSFLSGTFVTFTNLSAEDEARIIEQHISPLRVSLHASNPEVRRRIIGRHAQHGIEVMDRLLAAGIEFHAQIVLMPDENDGDALRETLDWAYARPGILDICIVPLGFTKHQTCFTKSFNDPVAARAADGAPSCLLSSAPLPNAATCGPSPPTSSTATPTATSCWRTSRPPSTTATSACSRTAWASSCSFVDDCGSGGSWPGSTRRPRRRCSRRAWRVRYIAGMATPHFFRPLFSRGPLAGVVRAAVRGEPLLRRERRRHGAVVQLRHRRGASAPTRPDASGLDVRGPQGHLRRRRRHARRRNVGGYGEGGGRARERGIL